MSIHPEWRPVVGYEGIFAVSDDGQVKRVKAICQSRPGRILSQTNHVRGYLAITLTHDKRPKTFLVHRLVAEAFIGPLGSNEVNHIDGNKKNNRIDNLEIVSRQQNIDHAVATGLINNKGENNSRAKLTADQVMEIRAAYTPGGYRNGGRGYKSLSKQYEVKAETIRDIIKGKSWRHIEDTRQDQAV